MEGTADINELAFPIILDPDSRVSRACLSCLATFLTVGLNEGDLI